MTVVKCTFSDTSDQPLVGYVEATRADTIYRASDIGLTVPVRVTLSAGTAYVTVVPGRYYFTVYDRYGEVVFKKRVTVPDSTNVVLLTSLARGTVISPATFENSVEAVALRIMGDNAFSEKVAASLNLDGVQSFNGRKGTVVPASGDYSYSQVQGLVPILNSLSTSVASKVDSTDPRLTDARPALSVTDTALGDRTIDPAAVPTGNTGKLTNWLSWLANRLKAITGGTDWYSDPPVSLTTAKQRLDTIDGAIANLPSTLTSKADKTYVDAGLLAKADKTYVDTGLSSKANTSSLSSYALTSSLANYVLNTDGRLTDARSPLAGSVSLTSLAAGFSLPWAKVDKTGATASDVGADPSGTAMGMLSAHIGTTDPHTQYATKALLTSTLTGYVTSTDGRLTDARVPLAHNQAWGTITGTPTSLAGYGITDGVTQTALTSALASKADTSTLTNYVQTNNPAIAKANSAVQPNTDVTFNNLSSSQYQLGLDLTLKPIYGGQSVLKAAWGLQIGGLSSVLSGIGNIDNPGDHCVVVAPETTNVRSWGGTYSGTFSALTVVKRGWHTGGALQKWQNDSGTEFANLGLDGSFTTSGSLTLRSSTSGLTMWFGGNSATPVRLGTYQNGTNPEYGFTAPMLKITNGRMDFDPLDGKAEIRVTGATTQLGVYNVTNNRFYLRMTSDGDQYVTRNIWADGNLIAGRANPRSARMFVDGSADINGNIWLKPLTQATLPPATGNAGAIAYVTDGSYPLAVSNGTSWVYPGSGGSSGVSSFNGRTGTVTPQASDYSGIYQGANGKLGDIAASTPATGNSFFWNGTNIVPRAIAQADVTGLDTALAGKVNSTDTRLTDNRTPVDGSVTDAKVASGAAIAWSKISKTGAVASDVGAVPSSLTLYHYIQQAAPVSPTAGQRWLELDATGAPVEAWYYDSTNTRWLSINTYASAIAGANLAATTTLRVPFDVPGTFSSLLLIRAETVLGTATAHNATNFYSINYQAYGTGSGFNLAGTSTYNTQALPAGAPTNYGIDLALVITVGSAGSSSYAINYTKTGTPANINYTVTFVSRKIR